MATFVLLCNENELNNENELDNDVRKFVIEAKNKISNGKVDVWSWSCGNTKGIEVGDEIFIQRTGKHNGYFAYGVAAPVREEFQLRLTDDKYRDFSEAYINPDFESYGNSFVILVDIYSIVDYEYPLEKKKLKELPEFENVFLDFRRSGCELKPDVADVLFREWEKHLRTFR